MKIGNKYHYFKNTPILSKNPTDAQKFIYKHQCFLPTEFIKKDLRVKNIRLEKIRIENGATIFIERWDGNGIHDEVRVLKIEEENSHSIKVICDQGYFYFNKNNAKTHNTDFNWICEGKEWEKKNKKWVDGRRYYYENKK
jgi:hypothetical protein